MHYNFLFLQVAVADMSIIIMNPINISYILTNQMNQDKDNMRYLQTKYSEEFNVSGAIIATLLAPLNHIPLSVTLWFHTRPKLSGKMFIIKLNLLRLGTG